MKISLIAGMGKKRELGINNTIPWHVSSDFKHFKRTTMNHHMLMGRKTFESIGRPLPGRTTIVLTRDKSFSYPGVVVVHSQQEAIDFALNEGESELFICGGAEIYQLFLPLADKMYLSKIDYQGEADTFFPEFNPEFYEVEEEVDHHHPGEIPWRFELLVRREECGNSVI